MTPEERIARLEEMAVAVIALTAVVAPGRIAGIDPPPPGDEEMALAFGLLLRPDVAALFTQEQFGAVYERLTARMHAHAALHVGA